MATLKKIIPFGTDNSPHHSFKIFFLSEGYLGSEEDQFTSDCLDFIFKMKKVVPFNITKYNPNWISVYIAFEPSNNHGLSIDSSPSSGRTAFDGQLFSNQRTIAIDQQKLNSFINNSKLSYRNNIYPLSDFCVKSTPTFGPTGSLIVVLAPSNQTAPNGGEYEHSPAFDDFYFIATTKDKYWHQVILRAMGKSLGLGDEFELAGPNNIEPSNPEEVIYYPNLQYLDPFPTSTVNRGLKWYPLLSSTQRSQSLSPKGISGSNDDDQTFPPYPTSKKKVEFWEGGGGFQTKVYRSSKDCLMRRQIGNLDSPIRDMEIPFCFVCKNHFKGIIS